MDGYMCERRRDHPGDASRARRCFVKRAIPAAALATLGSHHQRKCVARALGSGSSSLSNPRCERATPAVKDAAAQAGHEHRSPCQDNSKKAKNRRATCRSPTVAHAQHEGEQAV